MKLDTRRPRIIIRGSAAVFRDVDRVTDPAILRTLDGLEYGKEIFTDYIGGPPEEDALAAALERGGIIRFTYRDGDIVLVATTEYQSRRQLTEAELRLLVECTMGQWSDGIGENWTCESPDKCGDTIMCLPSGQRLGTDYPAIEVITE
jgi:hypothetical protein